MQKNMVRGAWQFDCLTSIEARCSSQRVFLNDLESAVSVFFLVAFFCRLPNNENFWFEYATANAGYLSGNIEILEWKPYQLFWKGQPHIKQLVQSKLQAFASTFGEIWLERWLTFSVKIQTRKGVPLWFFRGHQSAATFRGTTARERGTLQALGMVEWLKVKVLGKTMIAPFCF